MNTQYIMSKTILITGGCGFIGHHIIEHIHKNTDWNIIVLDMLSYASSGLDRFRSNGLLTSPRLKIITCDLSSQLSVGVKKEIGTNINYIIHMCAETHVDNSIANPVYTIHNNVMSTVYILEYVRELMKECHTLETFFYFSTDEVFGSALGDTLFKEGDRHHPTNPYSSSKSASEMVCLAYENTYKIPLIIVNVMNVFGERQNVEKFIPLCIKRILNDEIIPIHTYPNKEISGTRFYIHARNVASAILFLISNGKITEKYNIVGQKEVSNKEIALMIGKIIGKEPKLEMVDFHSSRPGHDLRYGLDGTKLKNMGFEFPVDFEHSLEKTVRWTLAHPEWLC